MKISILSLNRPVITDFAKERNELLKKAKTEWVLFLDTDEKLSNELSTEISVLNPAGFKGFYVYRKNYFLGQPVGTDKILRLGRKNAGGWRRKVHERWEIKGKVGELKNPIIHNSARNLHEMVTKINFYSTLHSEANLDEGKKSNLFKIIFYPPAKFFESLFMGRGFVFSMLQSFHSFLSWSKEWELQKV